MIFDRRELDPPALVAVALQVFAFTVPVVARGAVRELGGDPPRVVLGEPASLAS